MFGKNQVVSQQYFKNYPEATLKITTIFLTLQGEGPFSGRLAVFVRLSKCNLRCSFCDTFFDAGDDMSYSDIFNTIQKTVETFYSNQHLEVPLAARNKLLLVITGGEPLLQKNLTQFLYEAHSLGYETQIESNGIVQRDLPDETHLIISPKVNERINKYISPNPINLERANTLKFVISENMSAYTDIPKFALDWYGRHAYRNLYVSPMNMYINQPIKLGDNADLEARSEVDERISFWTPNLMDPIQNQKNHEYAAYIAMKYGCRLSLQTHLYASLP